MGRHYARELPHTQIHNVTGLGDQVRALFSLCNDNRGKANNGLSKIMMGCKIAIWCVCFIDKQLLLAGQGPKDKWRRGTE